MLSSLRGQSLLIVQIWTRNSEEVAMKIESVYFGLMIDIWDIITEVQFQAQHFHKVTRYLSLDADKSQMPGPSGFFAQ
jgi:hypothetical protein